MEGSSRGWTDRSRARAWSGRFDADAALPLGPHRRADRAPRLDALIDVITPIAWTAGWCLAALPARAPRGQQAVRGRGRTKPAAVNTSRGPAHNAVRTGVQHSQPHRGAQQNQFSGGHESRNTSPYRGRRPGISRYALHEVARARCRPVLQRARCAAGAALRAHGICLEPRLPCSSRRRGRLRMPARHCGNCRAALDRVPACRCWTWLHCQAALSGGRGAINASTLTLNLDVPQVHPHERRSTPARHRLSALAEVHGRRSPTISGNTRARALIQRHRRRPGAPAARHAGKHDHNRQLGTQAQRLFS